MKKVTVELSDALDKRVRIQAAYLDVNRSQFIRQALEDKLARLQNPASDGDVDNPGGSPAGGSSAAAAAPNAPDSRNDRNYRPAARSIPRRGR